MRIPQILDFNTQEAFRPSKLVKFVSEKGRQTYPEDFNWNIRFVPTLAELSLRIIAENYHRKIIYHQLLKKDQNHIQELISTELDLNLVINLFESEHYWKRRYQAHFSLVPLQPHLGWTWKCLYLEQHLRTLLENAEPQFKDEETFEPILTLCSPYIHVLHISQLRHWVPPRTLLPEELPEEDPIYHISFIPILKHLPNLIQLDICYGMNNVGENYDRHMFKLDVEDCFKLGDAVAGLKHLKVLNLHRSEVECKHVRALVKRLKENTSLVELNLSHCKIGDLGAKCIGLMLMVHEKLKVLRLKNNKIGQEGIEGISWALLVPEGCHLQVLDLSMNPLGVDGCKSLMCSLVRGILPQDLHVAHCNIHGAAACFISSMLTVNNSLRRLDVSGNQFGLKGGQSLLEALQINSRIIDIDIRDTGIAEETKKEIKRILKHNLDISPQVSKCSINNFFIDRVKTLNIDQEDKEEDLESETFAEVEINSSLQNLYSCDLEKKVKFLQ